MAAPCPLLGDGVTDDTLLHIARFLPNVNDLLRLQLTCPRFAAKVIAAPSSSVSGGGGAAAAPEIRAGRLGDEAWVCWFEAQVNKAEFFLRFAQNSFVTYWYTQHNDALLYFQTHNTRRITPS